MSQNKPTPEEANLARQLADPLKATRDRATAGLGAVMGATGEMSDMEMLKFWKGLYYCLWLSDKSPIQQELATSLSRLVHACSSEAKALQFLGMFYRTILREWAFLDQYRVNKFYSLLRFVLREMFVYLHSRQWPAKMTDDMLNVLRTEILCKLPNGPRFHYADIFLPELLHVTKGEILTGNVLILLAPFTDLLSMGGSSGDSVFKDRVEEKVFGSFAKEFAVECKESSSTNKAELEERQEGGQLYYFTRCRTGALQVALFTAASDEMTVESNRRRLYDIHKVFQKATGVDFAEQEPGDRAVATPLPSTGGGNLREKEKKKEAKAAVPVAAEVADTANSKDKRTASKKPPAVTKTSAIPAPVTAPVTEPTKDGKGKRKAEGAPAAAKADKIPKAQGPENFIAASKFEGKREGMVFKKGGQGLGYYIDSLQQKVKGSGLPKPASGAGKKPRK